jgi:hypothetical protein
MPTIHGKWELLADGRIRAWYTSEELAQCLELFETIKDVEPARQ